MSFSPPLTVGQTKEGEEEELLAIDQGRSHTSSPRSRPNSRLEIRMMDLVLSQTDLVRCQTEMARSQEEFRQKLESLARAPSEQTSSQWEVAKSTEGKLTELVRGQAVLAYAQIGHVA